MASVWFVFKTPTIIGRLHVLPPSFFTGPHLSDRAPVPREKYTRGWILG